MSWNWQAIKQHFSKRAGIYTAIPVLVYQDFGLLLSILTGLTVATILFGPLILAVWLLVWVHWAFVLILPFSLLWTIICWIPEENKKEE